MKTFKNLGVRDCITLDGDRVAASGLYSGGFVDPSRYQRVRLQHKISSEESRKKEFTEQVK